MISGGCKVDVMGWDPMYFLVTIQHPPHIMCLMDLGSPQFPHSSASVCHCQFTKMIEALEQAKKCLSCIIWSPLHSQFGGGRGQGELSWRCGLPKIELVMKKSTSWRRISNFLWVPLISYPLASFSIRKCEMPPWCFTVSERLLSLVSFSLMRKQWYGTLLSLSSAVSCEILPWYHACPCSSISVRMQIVDACSNPTV